MATTPARIPPEGIASPAGIGSAQGVAPEAAAREAATQDTERPPPLAPERQAGAGPRVDASARRSSPCIAEATTVGPAPDPGELARELVGPPTPRALRAAQPVRTDAGLVGAPTSAPRLQAAPAPPRGPLPTSGPGRAPPRPGSAPLDRAPILDAVPAPPPDLPRAAESIPGVAASAPLTRSCASCGGLYPSDFLVCPRDATPLVAAEGTANDPFVGKLINETYQIVRVVGEGGMGRVYEARHLRLKERRFAIKCLHADLARNAEMAARFLREAESASSIKHENVVDVFDVHHLADGTPYLVGEFLEGEELAEYVTRRGPLEPKAAAKIARQVCSALAAAHARGIVHRDMKPENVFVLGASIAAVDSGESRLLRVKVLDFGISKAGSGERSHLTRTGVIMGTPSYMAPEQARGRAVDHRADVYSVGACLYFMVTGRRPFDSEDPTSTISMVLTEEPVRPRAIDPRIPESLELVIQRAMAKDASDRYASMAEMDRALASLGGGLGGAPSVAKLPSAHATLGAPLAPPELRVSGAARALDVAKAVIGGGSIPPPGQQSGSLARNARPVIVVTSAALGAWLVGGTVSALAGLVRVLHDGEVTLTESLLLVVGCLFASATPIALYVMNLRRVIWPNSVRALKLATDLKRMTIAALVSYGAFSIVARIGHTVFFRSSHGLTSGVWDILLFAASLAVALAIGGFGTLVKNLRRGRIE